MKWVNRKQTLIITGNTAQEFQDKLNSALDDLSKKGCKHDLQFNMQYGLCAYIIYEEHYEVAETLADKYELNGEMYRCYECKMFNPSKDRRVKYTACLHGERRIHHSRPCCEWFYEQMEKGESILNETAETSQTDFE